MKQEKPEDVAGRLSEKPEKPPACISGGNTKAFVASKAMLGLGLVAAPAAKTTPAAMRCAKMAMARRGKVPLAPLSKMKRCNARINQPRSTGLRRRENRL